MLRNRPTSIPSERLTTTLAHPSIKPASGPARSLFCGALDLAEGHVASPVPLLVMAGLQADFVRRDAPMVSAGIEGLVADNGPQGGDVPVIRCPPGPS